MALRWINALLGRLTKHTLYIFLDEAGDFNFSPTGTRYFVLTSVAKVRPFNVSRELHSLKYDLMEAGSENEYFHASEDRQHTRDKVFEVIKTNIDDKVIDALVVEKRKTGPALQDPKRFYPEMLGYLLTYVLKYTDLLHVSEVIIVTDTLPLKKKRQAIEKTIKTTLKTKLPKGVVYRLLHHASKSCFGLQIADYCSWAIFRKWQKGDSRSYDLIKHGIRSEFDIFRTGTTHYY